MKALVYDGPGKKSLQDRRKPVLQQPSDAIVRITKTTICGTDLHILKGDVPTVASGRILGHEGVGIVETVGSAVTQFRVGDHVLISCISSCGRCEYCRKGMFSHCMYGGWILGNTIDGTQAEFVRIPHADTSLYRVPDNADEEALVMLSDILPTGFECGVLNGKIEPGSTVAIIGSGPIGLASLLTAQFYSPARIIMIDLDGHRLKTASRFGATGVINAGEGDVVKAVLKLTEGRGVDTAIEAVGIAATFEMCEAIIAPGGVIANVGVHGTKADLHLETLWSRNITITTRLVDTITTPTLMKAVASGKLDPRGLITHRFELDDIQNAYSTFAQAESSQALKVIITVPPLAAAISKPSDRDEMMLDNRGTELISSSGLAIHIRPVRDRDGPILAELFKNVAAPDLRFRFLGAVRELSAERLFSMTHVDHVKMEHFLCFAGSEAPIASAMIARGQSMEDAEVAIAVHSDYRHMGVAWELLGYVTDYAQKHGIRILRSLESRSNHDAIKLEREQGFVARPYPDDPTLVMIERILGSKTATPAAGAVSPVPHNQE